MSTVRGKPGSAPYEDVAHRTYQSGSPEPSSHTETQKPIPSPVPSSKRYESSYSTANDAKHDVGSMTS